MPSKTFEDDPGVRQAFMVEDIRRRENFVFVHEPTVKQVDMHQVYGTAKKVLRMSYREDGGFLVPVFGPSLGRMEINPLDCSGSFEYFRKLYDKAMHDLQVVFFGWVDPDTMRHLNEDMDEEESI